jgi:hypothetical protein
MDCQECNRLDGVREELLNVYLDAVRILRQNIAAPDAEYAMAHRTANSAYDALKLAEKSASNHRRTHR